VRQLKAAGCEKVFREKITGTTADRPQLAKLMKALTPGDVVITPAVDRLSRDTTDLLVIAREMQRAGAGIRSLAEPAGDACVLGNAPVAMLLAILPADFAAQEHDGRQLSAYWRR
jgi:DNA invertase Pin-like site-specific DNA recombinase